MYDFPSSPLAGQIFQPPGGPAWTWNGQGWQSLSGTVPVALSDSPPSPAYVGQLWWESDTGNLYVYYDDGDSAQWVQTNVSTIDPKFQQKTAETRNRIVNGAMQHSSSPSAWRGLRRAKN